MLCVLFFFLGVAAWILCTPFLIRVMPLVFALSEPPSSPRNPDRTTGMALFAVFMVLASVPVLLISLILSFLASGLPLWFRLVSLFPALAGVVGGIVIFRMIQ